MSLILVVDDMPVFREPIAASLRLAGYETMTAGDGKEALAQANQKKPDVILLDLSMPVMDGITMLKSLRQNAVLKDTPVILLTAVSDKEKVVEAAKLGIRDYMLKSQFSNAELLTRIQKYASPSGKPVASPAPPAASPGPAPAATASPAAAPAASAAANEGPTASDPSGVDLSESINADVDNLKDLKPIMPRSEVQKILDDCSELKGFSPTVAQVLKLTSNQRCSIEQISKVIKQDHGIALKILKLANSSVYTRGEPVDSVHKAVMRIGLTEIRQAVLNISVVDRFSGASDFGNINVPQFWEHSIACGLIAVEIISGLEKCEVTSDTAFTMGLLHDVGRIVYLEQMGDRYLDVVKTAARLDMPLEQVESRMLLINHADAMDRLLHGWRFPKDLVNPIAFHQLSMNVIRGQAAKNLVEVATLALANRLAHALLLGSSGNQALYATEDFVSALRLSPKVIDKIEADVPGQTEDIKFSMLSNANSGNWPQLHLQIQEQLTQPFRPLFVSEEPAIDAVRIFCNRIKDNTPDEPPNVAVVHICKGREKARVTRDLKVAEKEAEVENLPLIIFSPNGQLTLEDSAMAGRHYVLLTLPVTLTRFVEAFKRLMSPEPAAV